MLVSTLLFAFIAALTIYLEHEYIMSLVSYKYEVDIRASLMKDLLSTSPTVPEMDIVVDPTEISWIPLPLNENSIYFNETSIDVVGETTDLSFYLLLTSAAFGGILLLHHYYRQPLPTRQPRTISPPRHSLPHSPPFSPRRSPNNQLQQQDHRQQRDRFNQFQRLQQRNFQDLSDDLEQYSLRGHRHRHRNHRQPPRPSSFRHRSPPPPYSPPPPPYSRDDPYPSNE